MGMEAVRCTWGSMCKGPYGYRCWVSPLGSRHHRRASLRVARPAKHDPAFPPRAEVVGAAAHLSLYGR